MPTLQTTVNGLTLPNPFVIASGPPGTNARVIAKAYDEGWGAVVAKTVCLDASRIVNVAPRYGRLRAGGHAGGTSGDTSGDTSGGEGEVYGWENIELITDRPFETWLDEFKRLKDADPGRVLIASIMEEYRKDAWFEIVQRCEAAGVDALELNLSCPHGLPERKMGSAMGEDPAITGEVVGWVMEAATVPVWAKLTPNVTRVEDAGRAALGAGCQGLSAINTIRAVIGVNLETLRPEPTVEGYSTAGGYSSKAIKPIALRMCIELAQMIDAEFPDDGRTLSGIGGIETGRDAAEYLLMGADTVQVCTGVMKHGYGLVRPMTEELLAFMARHGFETIDAFRGRSLAYMTTHADLVARQAAAKARRRAAAAARRAAAPAGVTDDAAWDSDRFVEQSEALAGR